MLKSVRLGAIAIISGFFISGCVASEYNYDMETIPEWQRIAIEHARGHTYEYLLYGCTEYTHDLVKLYNENGYNAKTIQGYLKYECASVETKYRLDLFGRSCSLHAWTRLYLNDGSEKNIESISGQEITKEQYEKCYIEEREGYYIVCNKGEELAWVIKEY